MVFWNTKRLLIILLLCDSRHVLVGLQRIQSIRVAKTIRGMRTHVGVVEERVRPPREGFSTNVEIIIVGREREVAIVLGLEVFLVLSVFALNLLHPEVASHDCVVRVNSNLFFPRVGRRLLAGRQP